MADEPNDPWSYGVTADDADPPWDSLGAESDADNTLRHHTGRWTSPSLGAYDPSAEHEALAAGDEANDAYFRDFGYGEGFGDGRLAAGYDEPRSPDSPTPSGQPAPHEPTSPRSAGPAAGALTGAPAESPAGPSTWSEPFGEPSGAFAEPGTSMGGALPGRDLGQGAFPAAGTDGNRFDERQEDVAEDDDGQGIDGQSEGETDTRRNLIEWAVVLVGAVLLALVLRSLVLQAFWIPSPSMESTLLVRDRVLVNKVSYRVGDIGRGDVVVFRRTDEEISQNPELPHDVIKRVIALGGETIEIIDNEVFIDGLLLREPYLDDGVTTTDFGPRVVPEDHVFVMGDNRELSLDSRFETGPVAEDRVVGRAFFLFWPVGRMGSL